MNNNSSNIVVQSVYVCRFQAANFSPYTHTRNGRQFKYNLYRQYLCNGHKKLVYQLPYIHAVDTFCQLSAYAYEVKHTYSNVA